VPEVFLNYRTGDGEAAAALTDSLLSSRFGADKIFFAHRSLEPGTRFPAALINEVLRSRVVLAFIGPNWPHDRRLHDDEDFVRRELLAAHGAEIPVIPIHLDRLAPRLTIHELPAELGWLAEVNSLRLDVKDYECGVTHIGDGLAGLVPALRAADQSRAGCDGGGATTYTARDRAQVGAMGSGATVSGGVYFGDPDPGNATSASGSIQPHSLSRLASGLLLVAFRALVGLAAGITTVITAIRGLS
jgi:TIR domain